MEACTSLWRCEGAPAPSGHPVRTPRRSQREGIARFAKQINTIGTSTTRARTEHLCTQKDRWTDTRQRYVYRNDWNIEIVTVPRRPSSRWGRP